MNIRTALRSSSALWVAPAALGITILYYVKSGSGLTFIQDYGWAPTLVSEPLRSAYAFAYGVASALGAWESGRLRRGAVWDLAPVRSRYTIAAQALFPVVLLTWLMLLAPVCAALVQDGVLPTPVSLRPLVLGLLLCVAHAVIGFAVGTRVPAVIAAPVLAVVVWLIVATSHATSVPWRRHMLGEYSVALEYGETATLSSIVAEILPTLALAIGLALLWLPLRHVLPRVSLAIAVAVSGSGIAYTMVNDWGTAPPLNTAQAPMRCAGTAPRVCMPEATVGDIEAVRAEVTTAVDDLVALGITDTRPGTVTDSLTDGRHKAPSTVGTWRLGLTSGERQGTVRYRVVLEAVDFPCTRPDPHAARTATMWLAERTGVTAAYEADLRHDDLSFGEPQRQALHETIEPVLALPENEQLSWYGQALDDACGAAA